MGYISQKISDEASKNLEWFCVTHRVPTAQSTTRRMSNAKALSFILEHADYDKLGEEYKKSKEDV